MFGSVDRAFGRELRTPSRYALSSTAFAATAFLTEFSGITAMAIATGVAYHSVVYGQAGAIGLYANIGGMAGLVYALAFLIRDEYSVESLLEGRRVNSRLFLVWNLAFVALAVIGFLTKSTAEFSRGWLLLFYFVGLVTVIALNAGLQRSLGVLIEKGVVRRRKLMIVGSEDDVARLEREISDGAASVYVAARAIIPDVRRNGQFNGKSTAEVLEDAARNARVLGIEDVVITSGLSRPDFLDSCVIAASRRSVCCLSPFTSVPVAS